MGFGSWIRISQSTKNFYGFPHHHVELKKYPPPRYPHRKWNRVDINTRPPVSPADLLYISRRSRVGGVCW